MTYYIYETITPHGHHYIGKHSWNGEGQDHSYIGSGNCVKNFSATTPGLQNFVLQYCDSIEELNEAEKFWIAETRRIFGKMCLNIAEGGDGGDVTCWMNDEERKEFYDMRTEKVRAAIHTDEWMENNRRKWAMLNSDEDFLARRADSIREAYKDPQVLQRCKEIAREVCSRPSWKEANKAHLQDEEFRAKQREAMYKLWEDEEFVKMQTKKLEDARSNPEIEKKRIDNQREAMKRPEVRAKLRVKYLYKDPQTSEVRAMNRGLAGRYLKGWICLGPVEKETI